jgi:poly(3-hydroxyalkanoate) depolymerase
MVAVAPFTFITVDGVRLRVSVTPGTRRLERPLLLINGIGAGLELFTPFRDALTGVETIAIDIPGTGGSPPTRFPRRFCGFARLLVGALDALGYGVVDALGVSWGGGLAQELARRHPDRVARLVLAATSTGALSVPGRPEALLALATPRRYYSRDYFEEIAPILYGGAARDRPELLREQGYHRALRPPSVRGYLWQLAAGAGWTSVPWLHRLHLPVLVMAGDDDPIVPLVNARILTRLLPHATLDIVPRGGHLFLLTHAAEVAPRIESFLRAA